MGVKTVSKDKHRQFSVVVTRDEDGYYVVECTALRGCFTQGETLAIGLKNIKEAIELCLEDDDIRDYDSVLKNKRGTWHTIIV